MASKPVICPVCGNSENSFKVSEIYLQSLIRLKNGNSSEAPIIDRLQDEIPEDRREKLKGSRYYRQLMESFAPPQGDTQSTRAINPDWVAFAMLLVSVYFLYQILRTQYPIFWYMVGVAVIGFAAYGIFRKKIFAKYQAQNNLESGTKGKVEKAVGQWMKLYYCSKDNVVYSGSKSEAVPIDQMRSSLLSQSK
ncbi:MAG: hypothetical protein AB9897_05050 [Anaerolineaceae bacterium]